MKILFVYVFTLSNVMYTIRCYDNMVFEFKLGALDTVECYDVGSAKWIYKAPMPYKLRTVKCAVVDDSIWVLAGYRFVSNTVVKYNTVI